MLTADEALRALQGSGEGIDPRWRKLALGELDADETQALHDLAMASEDGRVMWALYAPFTAEERQQVLDGVRERVTSRARH